MVVALRLDGTRCSTFVQVMDVLRLSCLDLASSSWASAMRWYYRIERGQGKGGVTYFKNTGFAFHFICS